MVNGRTYDDGGRLSVETHDNWLVTTRSYVPGRNLLAVIANPVVGDYPYTWDVRFIKVL